MATIIALQFSNNPYWIPRPKKYGAWVKNSVYLEYCILRSICVTNVPTLMWAEWVVPARGHRPLTSPDRAKSCLKVQHIITIFRAFPYIRFYHDLQKRDTHTYIYIHFL